MLKADLHIHTFEDPHDVIKYTARDMIKYKAKLGFKVLAITNHNSVYYSKSLSDYAKKLGVLLIPGMEALIEGKEVLLLGNEKLKSKKPYVSGSKLRYKSIYKSLDILDWFSGEGVVIGAPHPYFVIGQCLGKKLIEYIDKFDYIEYSHFYGPLLDRNKKAVDVARKFGKPLIASTDSHFWYQLALNNYIYIDASPNRDDILEAIRRGNVKLKTEPLSNAMFTKILWDSFKWKPMTLLARR